MTPDREIAAALDEAGIEHCVIGAVALAAWGFARFTADIDLLTMSTAVLDRGFWPPELAGRIAEVRRGDDDDPLAGVVRFQPAPAVEIIVGRGEIMRDAVASAVEHELLDARVASPIPLALLKLEAGGPQDIADLHQLAEVRRRLAPEEDFLATLESRVPRLSDWGKRSWERFVRDLGPGPEAQDG